MPLADVDDRGRIVIPRELREAFGIVPGARVSVDAVAEGIVVRPALPMREMLRRLKAAVPRRARGPRVDALRLKDMWTEGLPRRGRAP